MFFIMDLTESTQLIHSKDHSVKIFKERVSVHCETHMPYLPLTGNTNFRVAAPVLLPSVSSHSQCLSSCLTACVTDYESSLSLVSNNR